MPDLNSLALFARVVEANGFSEAARQMNMPTSTVSRRVADLEAELGVRLLERSTRSLRLTEIGAELLDHARRSIEVGDAVGAIVSNHRAEVVGSLRLSAPPSISDSLIAPLVGAFQAAYPKVSVHVFITERFVDLITDGIDVFFRVDPLTASQEIARPILRYRHQLVASPQYLRSSKPIAEPQDLLGHRLLAFSQGEAKQSWTFAHADGKRRETIAFRPHLAMNDFSGLAWALVEGGGVGNLPPIVQPHLLRDGRLVELMPQWRFPTWDLAIGHLANRYVPRPVRLFIELAERMAPSLFPELPR